MSLEVRWIRLLATCLAGAVMVTPCNTQVTIDNTKPRRDQHGSILNAHDGHVFHDNGTYYLVGTSYTHCNMNNSNACTGSNGKLFPQVA